MLVVPNPYYTKVAANGTFTLNGVPAGTRTLVFAGWNAAVAQLRARYAATIKPLFVLRGTTPPPPDLSGLALRDRAGTLHNRYGAQSPCLYLIRPDKYIAYRCQPVDFDRLLAYLDRVLIPQAS